LARARVVATLAVRDHLGVESDAGHRREPHLSEHRRDGRRSGDGRPQELHAELEVPPRMPIARLRPDRAWQAVVGCHARAPPQAVVASLVVVVPSNKPTLMTMNSAGVSIATPTSMCTSPASVVCAVLLVSSQRTKNASCADEPFRPPCA